MKIRTTKFNVWPYAITMTAVFLVFKLCGVIDWSWWLVFLPVIIASVFLIMSCMFVISVIMLEYRLKRNSGIFEDAEGTNSISPLMERLNKMKEQVDELQRNKDNKNKTL